MSIRSLPERKGFATPPGAGGTQQRFDRVQSTLKFKAILVDLQNLVRQGILPEKKNGTISHTHIRQTACLLYELRSVVAFKQL